MQIVVSANYNVYVSLMWLWCVFVCIFINARCAVVANSNWIVDVNVGRSHRTCVCVVFRCFSSPSRPFVLGLSMHTTSRARARALVWDRARTITTATAPTTTKTTTTTSPPQIYTRSVTVAVAVAAANAAVCCRPRPFATWR